MELAENETLTIELRHGGGFDNLHLQARGPHGSVEVTASGPARVVLTSLADYVEMLRVQERTSR